MKTVIERARLYAAKCPAAISGQGGHAATFHVASVLWNGFGLSETDTLALLREWNCGCRPPWSEHELMHKVSSVSGSHHSRPRGYLLNDGEPPPAKSGPHGVALQQQRRSWAKPAFCPMVLKRIAAKAASVHDGVRFLRERSPVAVESQDSASVLRHLYPAGSGEKVLVVSKMRSQGQMLWRADQSEAIQNRELPTGPDGVWFLPQPVDGKSHPNPRLGGKLSRRSEESVTAWRYAVLESDEAEPGDWLRCLIQMPLRIACICESGGRSIHALVRLDAHTKADWDAKIRAMKSVFVTLGADAAALSAVRLTRLPQAKRGERVQRLLYLNPVPDTGPIFRPAKGAT